MARLSENLQSGIQSLTMDRHLSMFGHVSRYDGQVIECGGFPANIGSLCSVETDDDTPAIAELIGFNNGNNLLSLHQFGARIRVGARVTLADDGANRRDDLEAAIDDLHARLGSDALQSGRMFTRKHRPERDATRQRAGLEDLDDGNGGTDPDQSGSPT